MNFSLAVPTYKRKEDLERTTLSVWEQSKLPDELIIIDDDKLSNDFIKKIKEQSQEKEIKLNYYKKKPQNRGLAASKNKAFEIANNEIVVIIDDDVILEKDCLKNLMNAWAENKGNKLMGIGGVVRNSRKKSFLEKRFNKIFGLSSPYNWDVNKTGFQVWDDRIKKIQKGYFMHGCISSFNKELARKISFLALSPGRTALEDVEFCLRAKNKGYYFLLVPEAKVIHKKSKEGRDKALKIGEKAGYNRKLIFAKNCSKDFKIYLWFYRANIGWILRQLLMGNFSKGFGMIRGLFKPMA